MSTQAYRVKHGGLMRCCLASLDEYMAAVADTDLPKEGDTLSCTYEKPTTPQMRFRDGAWEWNHV